MKVTTEQMLSKVYAAYRAANIGQRAAKPQYGNPASGGTNLSVYSGRRRQYGQFYSV